MTTGTRFQVFWTLCVQDLYRVFPQALSSELLTRIETFRSFESPDPNQLTLAAVAQSLNEATELESLIRDFNKSVPSLLKSLQVSVIVSLQELTNYVNELVDTFPQCSYKEVPSYLVRPVSTACKIRSTYRNLDLITSPKLDRTNRFSLLKNPLSHSRPMKPTRSDLLRTIKDYRRCGSTPEWFFPVSGEEQDVIYREARARSRTASRSETKLFQFS